MEELFDINNELVKRALINGIKVKKNGQFIDANGFISLTYISQFGKFVLAYGSGANDAGYVFVNKYNEDWILR